MTKMATCVLCGKPVRAKAERHGTITVGPNGQVGPQTIRHTTPCPK